ncbi:hypothetical protein C806_00014 [Lachnospiraceae bacterium 3-1]|nr:hypothetical protein C806_00014 [Lachnospiraceae bacterium 3-1]
MFIAGILNNFAVIMNGVENFMEMSGIGDFLILTMGGGSGELSDNDRAIEEFLENHEMTKMEPFIFKCKNITADAGYESEKNYVFLNTNGQLSYIKPANYEISKTRKYRNDIGKIENMEYGAESDLYICRNGKRLMADHIRHSKSKTGYVSEKTIYKCEDCRGCPYKGECIKGNHCKTLLEERTKTFQVARTFLKYRQEDLKHIFSDEGIVYRMNRTIQAEGSFGDLKQDM